MSNSGLDQILKNLQQASDNLSKGIADGFLNGLEVLSEQSLQECPLDEGDLRESYDVSVNGTTVIRGSESAKPLVDGKIPIASKLHAVASYDTPYALMQHENRSFNHPTPGTKAKYLEDPLKRNAKKIEQMIANEIKKVTK